MELLFALGLGVYMAGHGARGIPGTGLGGSVAMIIGGVLVIVSAVA